MIPQGYYKFRPRIVAFRNDYCLTCNGLQRAVQIRTFNVYHLCWIPLLPLGFWKQWGCTACGMRPGYNPRSRRKFALTLSVLAGAFTGIFWSLPVEPDQAAIWWFIRSIAPVVIIAALIWAVFAERTPSTTERLANVPSANETQCPFCQGSLITQDWRCVNCGVQRK